MELAGSIGIEPLFLQFFLRPSTQHATCRFVFHLTAPGQRIGDHSGFSFWQGIHPRCAGRLAEAGGWCCHCSGPQVPLSPLPRSAVAFCVPSVLLLHMGIWVWP